MPPLSPVLLVQNVLPLIASFSQDSHHATLDARRSGGCMCVCCGFAHVHALRANWCGFYARACLFLLFFVSVGPSASLALFFWSVVCNEFFISSLVVCFVICLFLGGSRDVSYVDLHVYGIDMFSMMFVFLLFLSSYVSLVVSVLLMWLSFCSVVLVSLSFCPLLLLFSPFLFFCFFFPSLPPSAPVDGKKRTETRYPLLDQNLSSEAVVSVKILVW